MEAGCLMPSENCCHNDIFFLKNFVIVNTSIYSRVMLMLYAGDLLAKGLVVIIASKMLIPPFPMKEITK